MGTLLPGVAAREEDNREGERESRRGRWDQQHFTRKGAIHWGEEISSGEDGDRWKAGEWLYIGSSWEWRWIGSSMGTRSGGG